MQLTTAQEKHITTDTCQTQSGASSLWRCTCTASVSQKGGGRRKGKGAGAAVNTDDRHVLSPSEEVRLRGLGEEPFSALHGGFHRWKSTCKGPGAGTQGATTRGYGKAEHSCLELMMSLGQRAVRQAGRGMRRLWKSVRFPLLLKATEGHWMTPYDVEKGTATGSFNLPPQPGPLDRLARLLGWAF